MNQTISKYRLLVALLSSISISIIGMLNMIIQSKDSFGIRFYIVIIIIFFLCVIDWLLLFGIDYIKKVYQSNKNTINLLTIGYLVVGVFITFWVIHAGNLFTIWLDVDVHVQENYIYRRIFSGIILCIVIYMTNYTFTLFEERERIMLENERLLRENLHAKFETLRQQVNPHFLFNSLSTLKTMMHNNVDKAEEYLLRLSDVFRYSLQVNDIEKVTLKEELDILEAYCFMLKGRFGENLFIDIQIDQSHFSMYIPPFSLQIIVENCVKHNIVSKDKPLFIKIFSNQAKQIAISNNLQPKNSVETSSRVGLANIEKRYQYLSGQHIEIIETPETFNVIIPLIEAR
jgi:two-component system, LytTR family, sensor kinase